MKALPALVAVIWLASSTYAGYRLTARSFAWIDEPKFGLSEPEPGDKPAVQLPDIGALRDKLPEIAKDPEAWFASLTASQRACLQKAIAPERYKLALQGGDFQPTAAELIAASACLK